VAHLSTERSVTLVRDAKRRGLPVTCEVTPHHLTLTDAACCDYDTNTKVNPPLRTRADVEALAAGIADGTVDAVATDHAPHSLVEKELEYDHASFGMVGLETALPLLLAFVHRGVITLPRAIELLTIGPARCFGLDRDGAGSLAAGGPADLTVFDPDRRWTVSARELRSKSKNTPFAGAEMRGRAVFTVAFGRVAHDLDGRMA
jgi:dihydroorotase